jgi:CTP:molybdopterin cytidylyltransferase MocA
MRVGNTAKMRAAPQCDLRPGALMLDPWRRGLLRSITATTVRAHKPGQTFVLLDMPMCAQVDDQECIGGIATVAYARVRVLPALQ